MQTLDFIDKKSLRDDIPEFAPGDTLNVHVNIVEGKNRRRFSRASLLAVRARVCARPSPFARFRSVLVLSVPSRFTLR